MKARKVIRHGILTAALAAMAIGACASAEDITLEFQQWWGVELPEGALQEIVDGFTEETGIAIELLSNPYADTRTQISAGAAISRAASDRALSSSQRCGC